MNEFELGEQIFEDLKPIFKLYELKETIYSDLLDLELCGDFGGYEYKKNIKLLGLLNNQIESKLKQKNYSTAQIIYFLGYLRSSYLEQDEGHIVTQVLEDEDKTYLRIYDYFFEKGLDDLLNCGNENLEIYIKFKDGREESLENHTVREYVNKDINRSFLTLLQDEIENPKNEDVLYDLLFAKYNLIYLNPEIENELISSNFKIGHLIPTTSSFYLNFMGLDYTSSKDVLLEEIDVLTNGISNITNDEYKHDKGGIIVLSSFLRANLFLLEQEKIEELNVNYYEDLSNLPIDKSRAKGQITVSDTFQKALRDKKKYHNLSIK